MSEKPASAAFDFLSTTPHQRARHSVESVKRDFAAHLHFSLVKDRYTATELDRYDALALAIRDRVVDRWIKTQQVHHEKDVKRVYYLSLEYLMGRALQNNLINLGCEEIVREALNDLNIDLDTLLNRGRDAGLGNGGLGRLAACFLDSLATLDIPTFGYGLCYDYGIFTQNIRDGRQYETPDDWLRHGNPWFIPRPEYSQVVHFGGRVETVQTPRGIHFVWRDTSPMIGQPIDMPIVGYGGKTVNNLRLWSAKAHEDFDFQHFDRGDYFGAVEAKVTAESITKVLYPNDNNYQGKELRFRQQYFFVSCSLQDIFRRYTRDHRSFAEFPSKVALHLNDTHPALAIPELMRLLLDEQHLSWEEAWDITCATTGYTNHTLMPEALERWPVSFFERHLPRHMQIIHEINRRFLKRVRGRFPFDSDRLQRMSLIDEQGERSVRMAYLSIVGSKSVNGVAALHTHLLQTHLFSDFYELDPEKFNNKTNGITPRRWLRLANADLAQLITARIGSAWITDLEHLRDIEQFADDEDFQAEFRAIKARNKAELATIIGDRAGVNVSVDSIFDVQVKRIHEYKRQLLNVMHIVMLYMRLRRDPTISITPRTFIFAGKAAPGYKMAKKIIHLIHAVGDVINADAEVDGRLRIAFIPNYGVSLAQKIIPAADISQQISTAGMEASGTGNMKFALNGALTIGTLDGANIEIMEEVGEDNIFIFGHTAEQVDALRSDPDYDPRAIYESDNEIRETCNLLFGGFFDPQEPGVFDSIQRKVLDSSDPYIHLADLRMYADAMARTQAFYANPTAWTRAAILNVARMGRFSSDRTIREYNREIWQVPQVPVD